MRLRYGSVWNGGTMASEIKNPERFLYADDVCWEPTKLEDITFRGYVWRGPDGVMRYSTPKDMALEVIREQPFFC